MPPIWGPSMNLAAMDNDSPEYRAFVAEYEQRQRVIDRDKRVAYALRLLCRNDALVLDTNTNTFVVRPEYGDILANDDMVEYERV